MEYDPVVHQPVRLRILAALSALQPDEQINFTDLRALTESSDGNLGAHLQKLEQAGYIRTERVFVRRKPCTWVEVTPEGVRAYKAHLAFLRDIVGNIL